MKACALTLLSGGLDSAVATVLALREYNVIYAITFDYGQRALIPEIKAAKDLCKRYKIEHRVIELPWLASLTDTALVNKTKDIPDVSEENLDNISVIQNSASRVWVPNRNGLFANIAACFADAYKIEAIILGFNAEEAVSFSDNKEAFSQSLTKCFSYSTEAQPKVISPTQMLTKKEIADHAVKLELKSFWSCYLGGKKMCGVCESCRRTIRAFRSLDRLDFISDKLNDK